MSVTIRPVKLNRSDLKRFVAFGINNYPGNDCYVPPILSEEVETYLPDKNPAFEFCEAQLFEAVRGGKTVGTVAALINRAVNERTGRKEARFSNIEFIDDTEVSSALMAAAEEWARAKGMTEMVGPLGFTDMDHEGMLIEGFNELGTMATLYNHPYYPRHIEALGYKKDTDWVEYRMTVPDAVPDKYQRIARIVAEKYSLRCLHFTSRKALAEKYGHALFHLINKAYDKLYGYSPLSERQIDYYIGKYLSAIRLDGICVIVDKEDKLVGVGISIPSMSRALQKGRGRMLPLGWYHLLKALKGRNDIVDLMLVAIEPEYQDKGVNALLFADLLPNFIRNGYKYAESNLELEDNTAVQRQWQYFERRQHRRRRSYRRKL